MSSPQAPAISDFGNDQFLRNPEILFSLSADDIDNFICGLEMELNSDVQDQLWLALVHMELGNLYFYRQGERNQNLSRSIAHHSEAIQFLADQGMVPLWAATNMNIASALLEKSVDHDQSNLKEAISRCEHTLQVITRSELPLIWGQAQMWLGISLIYLFGGCKRERLESAIDCLQNALQVFPRDAYEFYWSMTQANMGLAFMGRIDGDRTQNMEEAIIHFRKAMEVLTRQSWPKGWATCIADLGVALMDSTNGTTWENLQEAMSCFQQALEVLDRNSEPQIWAKVQMNLGKAYHLQPGGSWAANSESAIRCSRKALEVQTCESAPFDRAKTLLNLGMYFSDRVEGEQRDNFEEAIHCHRGALEVLTREVAPYEWSLLQKSLGQHLRTRTLGNRRENVEEAISCLRNSLLVRNKDELPRDWAFAQIELAKALSNRITGERRRNIEEGLECVRSVFDVVGKSEPMLYFYACEARARLTIMGDSLSASLIEIKRALDAADHWKSLNHARVLYSRILNDNCNSLYGYLMAIHVHEKDYVSALETYDRGKASFLFSMLSEGYHIKERVRAEDREEFETIRRSLRTLQYRKDITADSVDRKLIEEELRRQKEKMDRIVATASSSSDVLTGTNAVPFRDIVDFLRKKKAIALVFAYVPEYREMKDGNYLEGLHVFSIHDETVKLYGPTADEKREVTPYSEDILSLCQSFVSFFTAMAGFGDEKAQQESNFLKDLGRFLSDILNDSLSEVHASKLPTTLVIIPHRLLNKVPFSAAPVKIDRFGDERALGSVFEGGVWLNPSLSIAVSIDRRSAERKALGSYKLFSAICPTLRLRAKHASVIQEFGKKVKEHFHVVNPYPPRERINCNELRTCDSVHLTCHGLFAGDVVDIDDDPSEVLCSSGLFFAEEGATAAAADPKSLLRMVDIWNLPLNSCRNATLVSCSGAVSNVFSENDESLSIGSAFLVAGARNVICSMWPVNELAAAAIMSKFYESMGREASSCNTDGPNLHSHLWQAEQWFRNLEGESYYEEVTERFDSGETEGERMEEVDCSSLYHWAAFVLLGPP